MEGFPPRCCQQETSLQRSMRNRTSGPASHGEAQRRWYICREYCGCASVVWLTCSVLFLPQYGLASMLLDHALDNACANCRCSGAPIAGHSGEISWEHVSCLPMTQSSTTLTHYSQCVHTQTHRGPLHQQDTLKQLVAERFLPEHCSVSQGNRGVHTLRNAVIESLLRLLAVAAELCRPRAGIIYRCCFWRSCCGLPVAYRYRYRCELLAR